MKLQRNIAGGAMMLVAACSSPAAEEEPSPNTTAEPPVEVTARELTHAFEENEVAAMQRFGSKPLLIAGTVMSVELDSGDQPVVRLDGGDFLGVRLHFVGDNGQTTGSLKKGETPLFRCTGLREALGMPILDDCIVEDTTTTAIDAAKEALRAEPKIKDLTYNADDTVQWQIGVVDDGSSRVGYAQYVCEVLKEKDALAGRTHVRIVDIAKIAQGSDFRSASLGHVVCETGDVVTP